MRAYARARALVRGSKLKRRWCSVETLFAVLQEIRFHDRSEGDNHATASNRVVRRCIHTASSDLPFEIGTSALDPCSATSSRHEQRAIKLQADSRSTEESSASDHDSQLDDLREVQQTVC